MSTTNIPQLSCTRDTRFTGRRLSKSSGGTKVPLPLGSDEEGKRFFLPRQVACVKDHTEVILCKEKQCLETLCVASKYIYSE